MIFTCSWSDWFHEDADEWRSEAWEIVKPCPNLVFQILTKRPTCIAEHLPADWGNGHPNAWLGVSIESNRYVNRAEILKLVPAQVRFISAEPLLGPLHGLELNGIDWLIVGGESGPNFRHMNPDWARSLRDRAVASSMPYFCKQSSALRTETDTLLDWEDWRQMPIHERNLLVGSL